ncbi:MAG TPA: glycosyl hydrolase [Dehalococcoidia bacterium]|jgi:beta-mannanase
MLLPISQPGRRVTLFMLVAAGTLVLAALLAVGWRQATSPRGQDNGVDLALARQEGTADPCSPQAQAHGPPNDAYKRGAPGANGNVPTSPGAYLGVWQPGAPQDMSQLNAFEQAIGKHVAIVMDWYDWADDSGTLNLNALCNVLAHGSVPLITWSPSDFRSGADQSRYSLDNIIAGRFDGYIQGWAEQLATYGRPVLLRTMHEMNGTWYPWGQQGDNTPDKYIAAWRHIHDIFTAAGATNVQWVWSPNVIGDQAADFAAYYPGDQYVDWVGLDGYNFGPQIWRWFAQIFGSSYDRLTALTSKPLMIAEVGTSEALPQQAALNDTKAAWITDAFTDEIPKKYPRIRAVVWFNEDKTNVERNGYDWRVGSSAAALHAFAAAVASSYYLSRWP